MISKEINKTLSVWANLGMHDDFSPKKRKLKPWNAPAKANPRKVLRKVKAIHSEQLSLFN